MAKSSDSKLVCVSMVKLYMDPSGFIQAAGMRVPLHAVKSALLCSVCGVFPDELCIHDSHCLYTCDMSAIKVDKVVCENTSESCVVASSFYTEEAFACVVLDILSS